MSESEVESQVESTDSWRAWRDFWLDEQELELVELLRAENDYIGEYINEAPSPTSDEEQISSELLSHSLSLIESSGFQSSSLRSSLSLFDSSHLLSWVAGLFLIAVVLYCQFQRVRVY